MTKAESLNDRIATHAPAAAALLSRYGRALAFPQGIPAQSYEAAGCALRATIGQLTTGGGQAISLPALTSHLGDLATNSALLYAHAAGLPALREAWWRRCSAEAGEGLPALSRPVVVAGITHGLSVCADLFADEGTELVVARPYWGNYDLIFGTRRGAVTRSYPFFDDSGRRFNVEGLRACLAAVQGRALVLINFPSNPTGYAPALDEAEAIVEALLAHPGPAAVILDDAYHGWVYEEGALRRSLFWDLVRRADPARLLPIKIDGATKELLFFGGRTAFVTFGAAPEAGDALVDKAMTAVRGVINHAPSTSQALSLAALEDPALEEQVQERLALARARWLALRRALDALDNPLLHPYPFNGGFFALVGVHPSLPVDALRRRLIAEQSLGLISLGDVNALRIAFCSVEEDDLPEVVRRLDAGVRQAASEAR